MPYGKSYGKDHAPGVPPVNRRQAAKHGMHDETKIRPSTKEGTGHLGTLKPLPKP